MKKIFYLAALLLTASFVGCEKEDIEGTATESMAGEWYVQIDAVDENGDPITETLDGSPNSGEDYFGLGRTILLTYNTSANTPDEMWIDDRNEWNMAEVGSAYYEEYGFTYPTYAVKTKVKINLNDLTFSSTESENFGAGYQWWDVTSKKDENWNVVYDEYGDTIWVDTLLTEETVMPVSIEGKILKNAGHQNNGSVCDSIVFFITYKDDPWYPDDGYKRYKVSGVRYSGLEEND